MTKVTASQFTQQDGGIQFMDSEGKSYSYSRYSGPFFFNVLELSVFDQFSAQWVGDRTEQPQAQRQVQGEVVVSDRSKSFSVIGLPGKTTTRVGLLIRGRNSEQHAAALQNRLQTEDKFKALETACFDAYLGFTLGEKEYGTNDSWWLEIWVADETLNALADAVLADSLKELQIRVQLMDIFTDAGPGELDFGEDIDLFIRPDIDADGDKPREYGWGYGSLIYWYARFKGKAVLADPFEAKPVSCAIDTQDDLAKPPSDAAQVLTAIEGLTASINSLKSKVVRLGCVLVVIISLGLLVR